MSTRILVATVMKALRLHLGYKTQREFAEVLGWSPQRVNYMENGKFQPSLTALLHIGEATGYDASKIIRNIEKYKK